MGVKYGIRIKTFFKEGYNLPNRIKWLLLDSNSHVLNKLLKVEFLGSSLTIALLNILNL